MLTLAFVFIFVIKNGMVVHSALLAKNGNVVGKKIFAKVVALTFKD